MSVMWNYAIIFAGFVALQLILILAFRTFPDLIRGAILKGVERRNAIKIEIVRDELARNTQCEIERLRAEYATIKASADYLTANQSELRSRMIAATERLWNNMLVINKTFSDIIILEQTSLPNELEDAFERGRYPKQLAPLVMGELEAEFLKEAMRIMSGSKFLADSISDTQATMLYEAHRSLPVESRALRS